MRTLLLVVLTLALPGCEGADGDAGPDPADAADDAGGDGDAGDGADAGSVDAADGLDGGGFEDAGAAQDTVDYCNCVFLSCHDSYHDKWGEDELVSRDACLAEGESLPRAGSDVDEGDFIECRMHFCDMVPANCTAALGGDPCAS